MSQAAEPTSGATRRMADGYRIPVLGLGVWQVRNGPECVNAVRWALEAGYRHIDTAQAYGNEESVGQAIRQSGIAREEIFITTKFNPSRRDAAVEAEGSLRRLGTDYLDLYLVHWPQGGPTRAWASMERAHERGYARSLGVSNFSVSDLHQVRAQATVAPVVDQVQSSPFEYRRALLEEGERSGVVFEAYSPLGTGRHLSDRTVRRIGSGIGRSPAQVLLRWGLQHDLVVLAKSTHRDRISENARVFDFELSDRDMAELDGLDQTGGTAEAQEYKWW
jgi:diketogulonate reductase-like aldo/keto reductase